MVVLLSAAMIVIIALIITSTPFDSERLVSYENLSTTAVRVQLRFVSVDYSGPYNFKEDRYCHGRVPPGETNSIAYINSISDNESFGTSIRYLVTAIDDDRNIVFQELFTWHQLRNAGWHVVMKPTPLHRDLLGEVTYENRTFLPARVNVYHVANSYVVPDRPRSDYGVGTVEPNNTGSLPYYGISFQDSEKGSKYKYFITAVEDNEPGEDVNLLYQRIFTWDELNDTDWHIVIDPALSE